MDNDITSFAIKAFLRDMRERLEEARGIAEAADACARVGQTAEGVALANKTDELIYDAELLLGMTAWLARNAGGGKARSPPFPAKLMKTRRHRWIRVGRRDYPHVPASSPRTTAPRRWCRPGRRDSRGDRRVRDWCAHGARCRADLVRGEDARERR